MANTIRLFWLSLATFFVFLLECTYMYLAHHYVTAALSTVVVVISFVSGIKLLRQMMKDAKR